MGYYDYFLNKRVTLFGRLVNNKLRSNCKKVLMNYLRAGASILEIGPGNGELAEMIMSSGYQYTCYDQNSSIVNYLSSKGVNAKFGTIPPIPEADTSFDCVILLNVFEHMNDSSVAFKLLNEIHRILVPNGIVLLMAPDFPGWKSDFADIDYTHSFITSMERVRVMMNDANMQVQVLRNYYGCFNWFPGWFLDAMTSVFFGILRSAFPSNSKLLKGKIMFHPVFMAVARKKQEST